MPEKAKVPAIRFKGFTDAWEQRKLGDLADIVRGASPRPIKDPKWFDIESDIGWLRISDVTEQDGRIHFLEQRISVAGQEKTRVLTEPHLLLSIAATVGKPLINYVSTGVHDGFLIFQNPVFERECMFQWLEMFRPKWSKYGQPGSQVNLNSDLVKNKAIMLPDKAEQARIGEFLAAIDNLITLHQRKLLKLKNVKKAMLEKMFPKNGSTVPEIRFAGFTDVWEQRKLGEVVDVRGGKDYKHLSEGNIPVYGTGGYMLSVNEALSYKEDAIGIGRKGTIDKPYILKAPFWTVDTLFYADPRENFDLDFVFDLFQNIDWKKKDESTGVPSLSKTAINEIDVIVPKENEQKVVGAYFARIDNLITLHQRKLFL